jgi:hypothetical protein
MNFYITFLNESLENDVEVKILSVMPPNNMFNIFSNSLREREREREREKETTHNTVFFL